MDGKRKVFFLPGVLPNNILPPAPPMSRERLEKLKRIYHYRDGSVETYPEELITEIERLWAVLAVREQKERS
jgi:hypothetical protein